MLCWPEARKARLARPTQDEGTDDHNCDHSESDTTVEVSLNANHASSTVNNPSAFSTLQCA